MREKLNTDGTDLTDFFEADLFAGLGGADGASVVEGWRGSDLNLGAGDGEEGVGAGGSGESKEGGDDLVDRVVADDAAAVQAGDGAAAGVEQAEVVVYLGGGGDGGAGVARGIFA